MSSLPVKNLYQCIGEQVEALPNAVVHIENSVYLRSKAITADSESLRNFIDYAIKVIILGLKIWAFLGPFGCCLARFLTLNFRQVNILDLTTELDTISKLNRTTMASTMG